MNIYHENLKEFTSVSVPGSHKEEIMFMGKTVYTSDSLKQNIIKISNKYFSPTVSNLIISMVKNNKIIPVFRNKNIISYILNRQKLKKNSMATYYDGKIFLFLEAFYSFIKLSSLNEKLLASTLLHELMHVAEDKDWNLFIKVNFPYISQFYKKFFSFYLKVDYSNIKDQDVLNIIKKIQKAKKTGVINFRIIYVPVFKSLEKYSTLSEKDYQERFNNLMDYLDETYERFSRNVPANIWYAGQNSYKSLVGKESETLAQEFWSPSEIISVMASIKSDHQVVTNSIKILEK